MEGQAGNIARLIGMGKKFREVYPSLPTPRKRQCIQCRVTDILRHEIAGHGNHRGVVGAVCERGDERR